MVKSYLAHDEVSVKNPSDKHFEAALRVFVYRQPGDRPPTALLQDATQKIPSFEDILMRLRTLRGQLNEVKNARYGVQAIFRALKFNSWTSANSFFNFSLLSTCIPSESTAVASYNTRDRPPEKSPSPHESGRRYKYRKRFSFKTRSRLEEHEPPDTMKKYKWKPWKQPLVPLDPIVNIPRSTSKTKPTKEPRSVMNMDKTALVNAMSWEHPTRTLNVGTLNLNVKSALKKEFHQSDTFELLLEKFSEQLEACNNLEVSALLVKNSFGQSEASKLLLKDGFDQSEESKLFPTIKTILQEVVSLASRTKRICHRAIGQYIERLSIQGTDVTDRDLLDKLCPRVFDRKVASSDKDDAVDDNEADDDQEQDEIDLNNAQEGFLQSLLTAIYSSKLPVDKRTGSGYHVCRFAEKARDFLPPMYKDGDGMARPYAGSIFLRSTASQLSVELKKHYRNGSKELCEKVTIPPPALFPYFFSISLLLYSPAPPLGLFF